MNPGVHLDRGRWNPGFTPRFGEAGREGAGFSTLG
jgi:hypothetical protein